MQEVLHDFHCEIIANFAKIRYRAKPAKAILNVENNIAKVIFNEQQRAITPGQSVVFYVGDIVLGGGKIDNSIEI